MTAGKKAQGLIGDEYEKARICLQGQNHENFQVQNSTTNADAHLLRLFLAVQANPKHVLASFDVSNAFLNAERSEDVVILTQPAPELVQLRLVKPGTLYQCTKACYGLREAPKLWEEARDKTLMSFAFQIDNAEYSLSQSTYHPSLWFDVHAPCLLVLCKVRLPDESDLPDVAAFGEHKHVAASLGYVDDFSVAGPREILQPLLTRLLDVWKGTNPDFLGRLPGDVDTMRCLGLDIESGPEDGTELYLRLPSRDVRPRVSQRSPKPAEPESFSDKPHVQPHAQKARVKHPPLQPGQDPQEHTPVLHLVGVLLWVSWWPG